MDTRSPCQACRAALDHCHGTLVVHADGYPECTDVDCGDTDPVRHDFQIDCHTVAGGCDCAEPAGQVRWLAVAS